MPPITTMNWIRGGSGRSVARPPLKAAAPQRNPRLRNISQSKNVKISALKNSGHWPTLLTAFLYFDFSFMVWTVLGPLGAQIGETLHLNEAQKGLMVAVPTLSGAFLRILLGLLVDRIGGKNTGLLAQVVVMGGLGYAWLAGLTSFGS